jgi:hypothetical protein
MVASNTIPIRINLDRHRNRSHIQGSGNHSTTKNIGASNCSFQ